MYYTDMASSSPVLHEKRREGHDPVWAFRCPPALRKSVEAYAKRHKIKPTEALRVLVAKGLAKP